ncbi:MAG: hypothetical protein AAF990_21210 [Bacteroidota bacterium]
MLESTIQTTIKRLLNQHLQAYRSLVAAAHVVRTNKRMYDWFVKCAKTHKTFYKEIRQAKIQTAGSAFRTFRPLAKPAPKRQQNSIQLIRDTVWSKSDAIQLFWEQERETMRYYEEIKKRIKESSPVHFVLGK